MEAAVSLWGNTSVGLLLHWWQANKQQSGRGNIGKKTLAKFICLEPDQLSEDQLEASKRLLDSVAEMPLKPLNEIVDDANRAELDRAFLVDILGLPDELADPGGPLELLRAKLAQEPSIHGSKKSAIAAS
jgi:hypothetical protein